MTTIPSPALADLQEKVERIGRVGLSRFRLDPDSRIHGVPHWQQVFGNAVRISDAMFRVRASAIDLEFFAWFAMLHDCCRDNDGRDPEHGARAAYFAVGIVPHNSTMDAESQQSLLRALEFHSAGRTDDPDWRVMVCWDADRLDLPRVGTMPDPARMCTPQGAEFARAMQSQHADPTEVFESMKAESSARRKFNRESALAKLQALNVAYTTNNGGVHCMIPHRGRIVNYWPGTGLWRFSPGTTQGRGIRSLLQFLGVQA